tara:strand:+ start:813 stop:1004 length:192 start_codon:yes stop_codon:yes gene_type:complete
MISILKKLLEQLAKALTLWIEQKEMELEEKQYHAEFCEWMHENEVKEDQTNNTYEFGWQCENI